MSYASFLSPVPSGALVHRVGSWRQRLWQLVTVLSLALILGACGGGGGGGGGDSGGGGTGGTGGTGGGGTGGGGTGGGGGNPPPTGAPAIVGQPANVSVTAGQPASFSVTVTGTAPLTYEWTRNGVAIAGSNAPTYTIASTALADNGAQFGVAVSNAAGRVTSTPATLSVGAAVMAPSLTSQPAGVTTSVGQTARFEATATGSEPLTYQWQRNGAVIAGATAAAYTTPVLALADNGAVYTITVSNAAGTVTSAGALLTVNALATAPAITAQPAGQTVAVGQSATFRVVATGSPAPTYQWQRNGVDIAGATGETYATPSTTLTDNGAVFAVVVRNSAGSVTSGNAVLTVTGSAVAPSITTQPVAQSVITGQSATFSVAATGTSPLTYQWRRNGLEVAGANAATYTTPALTEASSGALFTVSISNSAGTVTSSPALLTVNPVPVAPAITAEPSNQIVTAGARATFSVTVTGTGPLQFQWSRNGNPLAGATSAAYNTPPTTVADNGAVFRVVVSNSAGSVTSATASLTVNPAAAAPTIAAQPAPQAVTVGQRATFSVTAAGTAPFAYQWRRNGADIAGATSDSYSLPATVIADNGALFTVVVSNAGGSVTSNAALLTVNPLPVAPSIATQPLPQTVIAGQVASFVVAVNGSTPLSYQWRRNGSNLAGANGSSYSTAVTNLSDNGAIFDVVVTNSVGTVTSNPVSLTVLAPGASNYWLRGESGLALAGAVTFANGPQTANRFDLTLVDPVSPSTPQVAEARGTWQLQTAAEESRFNPQNPGDATERFIVYARGTRLWRLDLLASGSPRPTPIPVQVSSASLADLCAPSSGETFAPLYFANRADAGASVLQYRVPGGDGQCQTGDDGFVAVRVNSASNSAPVPVPRIIAALNNQAGAFIGFLARTGNTIQRLDANLGNPTTAFTVGAGEIELLRYPSGAGTIVFRDGNTIRALDPAAGTAPATITTAGPDFQQLGEVGSPTPTALYLNNGSVISYRLDNSGPATTVLTLTSGQTLQRGGAISGQVLIVLASGGSSRLVGFDVSGSLTTLFNESGLIDGASIGATPTRWIYTTGSGTELRSVLRAGGSPVTLAQAPNLRVLNIGSWSHETVWYDLPGPGGSLFQSAVRAISSDGTNPITLGNAATVGGAVFNGFGDTSIGRIVAQPISASPNAPYSAVSLLALDMGTRATRVNYGALAAGGINNLDVSRLSGPDRPVLVTAARFEGLAATASDLYILRVGTPGLVRVTNYVP